MKNELMNSAVMELLPQNDIPQQEVKDIIPFLTDKYGAPEIQPIDDDKEEWTFSLPKQQLVLVRSVKTKALLDVYIIGSLLAVPCPTLGLAPLVRVAIGVGEATFTLSPITAIASATTLASISLARSFLVQQAGLCQQCPRCSCQAIPSRPPTTRIRVSVRRALGIPIGGTVDVVILQPLMAFCF